MGVGKILLLYMHRIKSYRDERVGNLRKEGLKLELEEFVCCIPSWPAVIPKNRVEKHPAGLVDILDLVRVIKFEVPQDRMIDGSDLSPLLKGKPKVLNAISQCFGICKSPVQLWPRDGDFSLVANPIMKYQPPICSRNAWYQEWRTEGIRISTIWSVKRSGQTQNIASDNPELLKELKAKLLEINQSVMADGTDWHLQ